MSGVAELFAQGHTQMRLPHWVDPRDHISVTVLDDGRLGTWVWLVCGLDATNRIDGPREFLLDEVERHTDWEPFVAEVAVQ